MIDKKIFGSFIEHIENCIEGGIYDKENINSDESGIRQDVLGLCREMSPSVIRFPGGTVMGIYHWEDYVGPVEGRKKIKNIIWGGQITREFGTAEFINFCDEIGSEPMICINMPTGTAKEAADWVEYCNGTDDTYYANLRRSHGYEEPFNVKYWCIGNESYAEPDLGMQHDVNVYIREAWEYIKYMKLTDPSIELVLVGNAFDMEWNKAVLDAFAPVCDYFSIHFYADGEMPVKQLEEFEETQLYSLEQMLDEYNMRDSKLDRWYRIPGRKREIRLALDEWNIWNPNENEHSKYGLYQEYTWEDAIWTAHFLFMLIRHSEHIGIANLAQLVNVIAPIMTNPDGVWKQTTFYPFMYIRKYCGKEISLGQSPFEESFGRDTVATSDDGRITYFVINSDGNDKYADCILSGFKQISLMASNPSDVNSMSEEKVWVEETDIDKDRILFKPYSINILTENE